MEGLYYLYSEDKGADQLHGYREADLRLCFRICKKQFSDDTAHINLYVTLYLVIFPVCELWLVESVKFILIVLIIIK